MQRETASPTAAGAGHAGAYDVIDAATEKRSSMGWLAWLLVPLLCLPCVLGVVGGVAAVTAGAAVVTGALTENLVVSLVSSSLVLAVGTVAGIVFVRRRRVRACVVGDGHAPVAAAEAAETVR